MWVLKLKTENKNLLGNLAKKYSLDIVGYPLSYYKESNKLYVTASGFMIGKNTNKKRLISELKTIKEVPEFESNNDFLIGLMEQPSFMEIVYNPKLIRPSPDYISHKGFAIWEIASFKKEPLMQIVNIIKEKKNMEILKFKKEKIESISFTNILPNLSLGQKESLDLAVANGYYDFPRKIDLHDLAKLMNISYSTFREHLKKAENKILPRYNRL